MLMATYQDRLIDAQYASRQVVYRCPACHERVSLHRGQQVAPYFAHLPQSACPVSGEGETGEHVTGKRQLAVFFRPWGRTRFEKILPTIQQRADVWVAREGQPVALELQCSPISEPAVAQRTAGYQRLMVYPLWLLGHRYARQRLNWALIERFACWLPQWGLCLLFWDVTHNCLRIRHHLHQDALGRYTGWSSRVTTLRDFVAGESLTFQSAGIDLLKVRQQWTKALLHGSSTLRPIQEQLYFSHHHLAGFPLVLASVQLTAPVFGRGLLLWRIVMGAWLFRQGPLILPRVIRQLAQQAFDLVGGHRRGVRFTADRAVTQATGQLLDDLTTAGYLRATATGWAVQRALPWAADYTARLKTNEKN